MPITIPANRDISRLFISTLVSQLFLQNFITFVFIEKIACNHKAYHHTKNVLCHTP